MLRLGAHESIAGGLHRAIERGELAGCESLQIWTKNSRQWKSKPLAEDQIALFKQARSASAIEPVVAHASYLINVASPKPDIYARSVSALVDEVERCEQLGAPYLVLHPGSHTGDGLQDGIHRAQAALRETQRATPGYITRILLETTAGAGSALGGTIEELAALLEADGDGARLGICLDTCHVFAAGHDLRTEQGYTQLLKGVEDLIGLDLLPVVHLNDSKHALDSHKDRHAHIGEGELGFAGFHRLLTDPRLAGRAGILETPKSNDLHEDRINLAALRDLAAGISWDLIQMVGSESNGESDNT